MQKSLFDNIIIDLFDSIFDKTQVSSEVKDPGKYRLSYISILFQTLFQKKNVKTTTKFYKYNMVHYVINFSSFTSPTI